jgi:hypothetical protein
MARELGTIVLEAPGEDGPPEHVDGEVAVGPRRGG